MTAEFGAESHPMKSTDGSEPDVDGADFSQGGNIAGWVSKLKTPDVNVYQHKKTVAQGMMDIALLSANANQLRYVLENRTHPYYYLNISLIGISIILQLIAGIGLIVNSQYNVTRESSMRKANSVNNYTVLAIFLITVLNIFISAFNNI